MGLPSYIHIPHEWHQREVDKKEGFGRLAIVDERDTDYPMSDVLPSESERTSRDYQYWWAEGWEGNQGSSPRCVAYACLHMLEDGSYTHFYEKRSHDPAYMDTESSETSLIPAFDLYNSAQKRDRWQGNSYDGTSVRGGMKALQKDYGAISSYHWAQNIDELVEAVLNEGPVVIGSPWYESMYDPEKKDDRYFLDVNQGGRVVGGHAYIINGVNRSKGVARMKNSWGEWAGNGMAYMDMEDLEYLVFDSGWGEAAIATEKKYEGYD